MSKQNKKEWFLMDITLWVIQVILGLAFIMFGSMKAFQYEKSKASLPWVKDSSKGLVIFIGVAEILGGLGVIVPQATGILTWLTPLAAVGIAVIMILAGGFHIKRKENKAIWLNLIFLLLALFIAYGRWFIAS
jgi:uncharacterized membrane protein YphA (DoxX/SURF4 family)